MITLQSNYHIHSLYCDGKNTLSEMLDACVNSGLKSMGFSSHAPVPFPSDWNMKASDVSKYQNEIQQIKSQYQDKIQIYTGYEIDYIPNYTSKQFFGKLGLTPDYTIASVHYLDFLDENEAWEIDGKPEVFEKGLQQLYSCDLKKVLKRYFYVMMEMIEQMQPDILGHLDKIKIQPLVQQSRLLDTPVFYALVNETLDLCSENEVMVEINNRGMYRNLTTSLYPVNEIIKMMYDKKIKIVLNTDAHQASEVAYFSIDQLEIIRKSGYKTAFQIIDNKWIEYTI